jgi:hypothetical protein
MLFNVYSAGQQRILSQHRHARLYFTRLSLPIGLPNSTLWDLPPGRTAFYRYERLARDRGQGFEL